MARYSKFAYNSGTKYGTSAASNTLSVALEIDWDNDGVWNGSSEDEWLQSIQIKRGRRYMIQEEGEDFEDVIVGNALFVLNNNDGRYSTDNEDSALYPNVLPGRVCKLRIKNNSDGELYSVFYGYIKDIRPFYEGFNKVRITVDDGMQFLKQRSITTTLYTDEKVEDLFTYILDDYAGWTDGYSIGNDEETIPYWWEYDKIKALTSLRKLTHAYVGKMFIDASGQFVYYSRNYDPSSSANITSTDIQRNFGASQPWDFIRNKIEVIAHPRKLNNDVTIWELNDTPLIEAGESLEIWADYSYDGKTVPAIDVISPVATTDYTMNAQADGGGSNLTANFTVTPTKFASSTKLEIENTGGTDGYITFMQLRGDALSEYPTTIKREDSSSISTYGERAFTLDYDSVQEIDIAIDFANYVRTLLASPKKWLDITIIGKPDKQLLELFDLVSVIVNEYISGDYWVAYLEHDWNIQNAHNIITRMRLEQKDETAFWTFTAQVGDSTRFTY